MRLPSQKIRRAIATLYARTDAGGAAQAEGAKMLIRGGFDPVKTIPKILAAAEMDRVRAAAEGWPRYNAIGPQLKSGLSFPLEVTHTIRGAFAGVTRQRGYEVSEAELLERIELALPACEEFARCLAMRSPYSVTLTGRRDQWLRIKKRLGEAVEDAAETGHVQHYRGVLFEYERAAAFVVGYEQLIEGNRHGEYPLAKLVCWHVMHIWRDIMGGRLSTSYSEEKGPHGPLIECMETMLGVYLPDDDCIQRSTLRSYVDEERKNREHTRGLTSSGSSESA
jgi:hypothetical protein